MWHWHDITAIIQVSTLSECTRCVASHWVIRCQIRADSMCPTGLSTDWFDWLMVILRISAHYMHAIIPRTDDPVRYVRGLATRVRQYDQVGSWTDLRLWRQSNVEWWFHLSGTNNEYSLQGCHDLEKTQSAIIIIIIIIIITSSSAIAERPRCRVG